MRSTCFPASLNSAVFGAPIRSGAPFIRNILIMLIRLRSFPAAVVFMCAFGGSVLTLGVDTHTLVNRQAALQSEYFRSHLREAIGFHDDVLTPLRKGNDSRQLVQWLEEGGAREDDGVRFLHHFHDPLQSPESAGLGRGPARFSSSIRWMHDPGQDWSWPAARNLYYQALTEADPVRRDALWADLFRAVGQIMHLVVDASVPEHTRNDMHPLGAMKVENSYERWVGSLHEANGAKEAEFVARYLSAPIGFVDELLRSDNAGAANAASLVARLVDADRYDGGNPYVTVGADSRTPVATGLAEIANANFFSEDTLRGQYPSPTDSGLIPVNLTTPFGKVRRYFSRPAGQGLLPANPVKAECASDGLLAARAGRSPYPCVDPLVWGQVAAHMLPRAVGYARGVLDYFFRGSLAVSSVTWDDEGVLLQIQNTSAEEMEGVFEIWARHDPDTPRERRTRLVTLNGGDPVWIGAGEPFWFEGVQIPPDARPSATNVLVFRGRLGAEIDAVAAQVFTVPSVDVRQDTYTASTEFVCTAPTGTVARTPLPRTTVTVRSESHSCGWQIRAHHITGTLSTNMPVDPLTGRPHPVIARIQVQWASDPVPVPIVIDGRPAGTSWRRVGDEADPSSFEIADPTVRPALSSPYVVVIYIDGRQDVVQLARIGSANVSHEKFMLLDNRAPNGPTLIASRRSVTALLWYDWTTRFEAIEHSGYVPPINAATTRMFGTAGLSEGLFVSQFVYLDMVMDDFEVFGDAPAAEDFYRAITLTSPHPDGPTYGWTAQVRRTYRPAERHFLKAFVTTEPEPFVVRLSGRAGGITGTQ
jgi:hypothetical protein